MKQPLLFAVKFLALAGGYFFTKTHTRIIKYSTREKSIANIAVLLLLQNLKRMLLNRTRLIRDSKNQVEMLENDVRLFKAFISDSTRRRIRDERVEEIVREIRALVNEGENAIDAFKIQAKENRSRSFFVRAFGGSMKLMRSAREVEIVRAKAKIVFGKSKIDFVTMRLGGESETKNTKLKKLTMFDCEFPLEDLTIIGESPHLEVLTLHKDASFGLEWVPVERNGVE